jgi:hypothetical protein
MPAMAGGLRGQYYAGTNFETLRLTRIDPTVDFAWAGAAPDPAVPATDISVRWTGTVVPLYSEVYTFFTASDDGSRLWVDGQLLVDQWRDQGVTEVGGVTSAPLVAGKKYVIVMEFYQGGGGSGAFLRWQSASQAKEIIPESRLLPPLNLAGPAWQQLEEGDPCTLSVAVLNPQGTPTYQWRKNGVDIAGATAQTYTILSVTLADQAEYSCWVEDQTPAGWLAGPVLVKVLPQGSLPVSGLLGLSILAGAVMAAGARSLRKK